jgi:hypothetical protein
MFGEGFDLPELKIAALHDIHKSLAVTIQFTGRFARWKEELGDATVIANIADADVEDALQNLYAEDPDWNYLLQRFTEEETEEHRELSDFLDSFEDLPEGLPVQNLFPKMSTVAYRTDCENWRPERISEGLSSRRQIYDEPVINREHRVAAFVTKFETPVDWRSCWSCLRRGCPVLGHGPGHPLRKQLQHEFHLQGLSGGSVWAGGEYLSRRASLQSLVWNQPPQIHERGFESRHQSYPRSHNVCRGECTSRIDAG